MDKPTKEKPKSKSNTATTVKSTSPNNKIAQTKSYIGRTLKENSSKVVGNENSYNDLYTYHAAMRAEQLERAQTVTVILQNYNSQQVDRNDYKKKMRPVMFWLLMVVILALTVGIVIFVAINKITTEAIVGIVSACVTYLGSLLTILIVIIKYIFPEDEDKNFNSLVTTIVDNDTERIKDDNAKEG